jgi:hypothetical protein
LEADWRLAVIEADSLVDDILKRIGFPGESMAERLAQIPASQLLSLSDLKEAHRIRNNVTHTPGFKISKSEAERVVRKYERVLKELEVI